MANATNRIGSTFAIAMVIMVFLAAQPVSAEVNPKIIELNQKVADIALLQQQLSDRNAQVAAIRKSLIDQQNNLRAEIGILAKSLKIISFAEAQKQLRIRFNLELLQTVHGYLDELDIKALFYEKGRNKLAYLQQSALDDIKMIATINDLKIEALVTQISLVISQYLPDAHVIQINNDNIVRPSAQSLWEDITTGRQ